MRHRLLIYTLLLVVLTSCQQPSTEQTTFPLHIAIEMPDFDSTAVVQVQSVDVTINDLNMRHSTSFSADTLHYDGNAILLQTVVSAGFYDITTTIHATVDSTDYNFRAYFRSIAITEQRTISAEAVLVQSQSDFVLAEIFTPGTQTPEGKTYLGDRYFVVFNNSSDTLYADGLVLLESKLKNTTQLTLRPDFRNESFAADAMYQIPGNGTDYPVAPGGCVLIVDNAIDHRNANPNSFDLSGADFEWYDQSSNPSVTDIDNPDVPNMHKIYCYTRTLWIPNNQGNTSFALGRIPEGLTDSAYLQQYKAHYEYTTVTQAGTFDMEADTYLFPNEWIIDAVNVCPRNSYQWTVTPASLDAGWTYVGETGSDKQRFGHCIRRKTLFEQDGRRTLQDTNNSTDDFLPAQTADPFYFND